MGENSKVLEKIMLEFYDSSTDNKRKREIEIFLTSVRNHENAWKDCAHILQTTDNAFVSMFCLNVIEEVIIKRWTTIPWEERNNLRTFLYNYVCKHHSVLSCFIRNKIVKLVVDIGRNDWPHYYPDFLRNIISLVIDHNSRALGLTFMLTTSEELTNSREEVCVARKDELKHLFLEEIPGLFSILTSLLQSITQEEISILISILRVLAHLFSWVPISSNYTPLLLSYICHFSTHEDNTVSVASISALNEILYKVCIPEANTGLVISICETSRMLLAHIADSDNVSVDSSCISKRLEMIRLIMSQHWHRVESSTNSSNVGPEILVLFCQTTLKLPLLDYYYDCLDIWCIFLDYLRMRDEEHTLKYKEALLTLVQIILKRMKSEVMMSDQCRNEDESDRSIFLENNVKTIGKILDILPSASNIILNMFNTTSNVYLQMFQTINPSRMSVNVDGQINSMENLIITSLTIPTIFPHLEQTNQLNVINNLANMVNLSNSRRLYSYCTSEHLFQVLLLLHCELLRCLRTVMPQYGNISSELAEGIICTVLPYILDKNVVIDSKLQFALAHLLSLLIELSKSFISIQPLLTISTYTHLPSQAKMMLQSSVCYWITHNRTISEEERTTELLQFFIPIMGEKLVNLKSITEVVNHTKWENIVAKKILLRVLSPWLQQMAIEYPECDKELGENIISFYLECFRVLQDLMPAQLMQKILQIFITRYSTIEYTDDIANGLDKLLQLLSLIIQNQSMQFKHFVSSCISLCLQHIKPKIQQQAFSNVLPSFYELLSSILIHKWQYFYKGGVMDNRIENEGQFDDIMNVFGYSFTQPDVTLFKQNLHSLQTIHLKWKLYYRDAFKKKFLQKYLTLLFNTLLSKSHDLLHDEIVTLIYAMAVVDFNTFYSSFLHQYLSQVTALDDTQRSALYHNFKQQSDLPTFVENVLRLVNDIRCYHICNGNTFST